MISDAMQALINDLIQLEHTSAYLYHSMSNYFSRIGLNGFAKWLRIQHDEERGHAQKLITYLNKRNGVVKLKVIPEQPISFGTPLDAFEKVLEYERNVTQQYRQSFTFSRKENDFQSMGIFQEFLSEQTEEEAQAQQIIDRLKINNNNPAGIIIIDQELGKREG